MALSPFEEFRMQLAKERLSAPAQQPFSAPVENPFLAQREIPSFFTGSPPPIPPEASPQIESSGGGSNAALALGGLGLAAADKAGWLDNIFSSGVPSLATSLPSVAAPFAAAYPGQITSSGAILGQAPGEMLSYTGVGDALAGGGGASTLGGGIGGDTLSGLGLQGIGADFNNMLSGPTGFMNISPFLTSFASIPISFGLRRLMGADSTKPVMFQGVEGIAQKYPDLDVGDIDLNEANRLAYLAAGVPGPVSGDAQRRFGLPGMATDEMISAAQATPLGQRIAEEARLNRMQHMGGPL